MTLKKLKEIVQNYNVKKGDNSIPLEDVINVYKEIETILELGDCHNYDSLSKISLAIYIASNVSQKNVAEMVGITRFELIDIKDFVMKKSKIEEINVHINEIKKYEKSTRRGRNKKYGDREYIGLLIENELKQELLDKIKEFEEIKRKNNDIYTEFTLNDVIANILKYYPKLEKIKEKVKGILKQILFNNLKIEEIREKIKECVFSMDNVLKEVILS